MSLFVALHPGQEAVEHLDEALERIRHRPETTGLHWLPAGRWHVTLVFLGEVGQDREPEISEELDAMGRVTPPVSDVHLAGSGFFGRQVLWLGVRDSHGVASTDLAHLARSVTSAMRGLHLTTERRKWQPHLSIARARQGSPAPGAAMLADYSGPSWTVDRLTLVRSTGGPTPVHRVVHTTRLAGVPPG